MKAKGNIQRRQNSTRGKLKAKNVLPRISVHRSNKYLEAQIIDDNKKVTIVGISEKNLEKKTGTKTEKAKELGIKLAALAKGKKITKAVFDRGRYAYHGRVKALAEGVKEGGIQI